MSETQDKAPAFVLRMPASFTWTVRIPVPGDDEYKHATLRVRFKPVSQQRLDAFRGVGLAEGEAPPSDRDIAHEVLEGWGLKDEAGEPVPFTPEKLDEVLAVPMARTAIVATYMAAMSGMAARKNG
jgi:hypothetical protein